MPNEPGGGSENAGEIEGKSENVPVGEVCDGFGRQLRCPPAICQENCSPAADKEQNDDPTEYGSEPSAASRQDGLGA